MEIRKLLRALMAIAVLEGYCKLIASAMVTKQCNCDFEDSTDLCGWDRESGTMSLGATAGQIRADSASPPLPQEDYSPGSPNGSYFYYRTVNEPSTDVAVLSFPSQAHLRNLSFAYFITSSLELLIIQENVQHTLVQPGNETIWERASYTLSPPAPRGGIVLTLRPFDVGEGPLDPLSAFVFAVDDIQMTFELPCDYDLLSEAGNLILAPPPPFTIQLGVVSTINYNASSIACPSSPFIFIIESILPTSLLEVFSVNSSTGELTINAAGPHLTAAGASGFVTMSVQVEGSDYTNSGSVWKKKSVVSFHQPPTINVDSSNNLTVGVNTNFTYTVQATSALGSHLEIFNITTVPSSLTSHFEHTGVLFRGIVVYSILKDIADLNGFPSFSFSVRDQFGATLGHTVQLTISEMPPIFQKPVYVFEVQEANGSSHAQHPTLLVGDIFGLDPNQVNCEENSLTLALNSSDPDVINEFHILKETFIESSEPPFCQFHLLITAPLDYEVRTSYEFTVVLTNSQAMSSVAMVTVNVLPVNEYSPEFTVTSMTSHVTDVAPIGTEVATLMATDRDKGADGDLSYMITAGDEAMFFTAVKAGNVVKIVVSHSPISPGNHILTVRAADQGDLAKSGTATLTVIVIASNTVNCNDPDLGPPVLIDPKPASLTTIVHSTATLFCNNTANPPAFPPVWRHQDQETLLFETLSASPKHNIHEDYLTIFNVTTADGGIYRCNASNLCGFVQKIIHVNVIDLPFPPTNMSISSGPFWENVTISWVPPPNTVALHQVDGYVVRVMEDGLSDPVQTISLHYFSSASAKTKSVSITGLIPGTNYTAQVSALNTGGEAPSEQLSFTTLFTAPTLSSLTATALPRDGLVVHWGLGYSGGSSNITMVITIQQYSSGVPPSAYEVDVSAGSFVGPEELESGRSYVVMATVSTKYGSSQYTTTVFVGFKDVTVCNFTSSSTCQWQLLAGNITSASLASTPLPSSDAGGATSGYYVSGTPLNAEDLVVHLMRVPSLAYVCGYSFQYQVSSGVLLKLATTSGRVWWESGGRATDGWEVVVVQSGSVPVSDVTSDGLEFVIESIGVWTTLSFAAVDNVVLHFCLPCDFAALKPDPFKLSYSNHTTLFLRSQQLINIQASIDGCPNARVGLQVLSVIPNQLMSRIRLPSNDVGGVMISDITTDIAEVGTTGNIEVEVMIVQSDYKHEGHDIARSVVIDFVVGEKFENCSFTESCDFENGHCEWQLNNQSNVFINETEENSYLLATPTSSSSSIMEVWRHSVNDSYCGVHFDMKTSNAELQMRVEGAGTVWSSAVLPNKPLTWSSATVYIDLQGVQRSSNGRSLVFELVTYDNNFVGEGMDEVGSEEEFVAIDNITLRPCIDCEAKQCSCLTCIRQCSSEPCQVGYFLSLAINRCAPCPAGHYCDDWRSPPTPCPPGTHSNTTTTSSPQQCLRCPANTLAIQGGAVSCQNCPPGYVCPDPANLPTPVSCDLQTLISSCQPGQYFAQENGSWSCQTCAPGYACHEGAQYSCPAGYYANQAGSSSCTLCPAGQYCPSSSALPLHCSAGQYSPSGQTKCLPCPEGWTSTTGSSHCSKSGDTFLTGIIGAFAGLLLLFIILSVFVVSCYCYRRRKHQRIKRQQRQIYKDNFLLHPDERTRQDRNSHGSGKHMGTVSTIMTLKSLMKSGSEVTSFQNNFYEDSDSGDEETSSHTGYSKSFPADSDPNDDLTSWSEVNSFGPTSTSHSDMSCLVELDDQEDHVWPALARKKKATKF